MKRTTAEKQIDVERVRRFLVSRHGLDRRVSLEEFCESLPGRLGCIQYDPLNVVGRNADLVLQSRVEGYRVGDLNSKMYRDRTLIDGWDKMMSIVHAEDWPCLGRLRAGKETEYRALLARRGAGEALRHAEFAIREIRERGPLRSDDLDLGSVPDGGWGHRKASGAVLEHLFMNGTLGVYGKTGTRKKFDLMERILPGRLMKADDPFATDRDYLKWFVMRRVRSVGVLWNKGGVLWQGIGPELANGELRAGLFDELALEGALVPFRVPGIGRKLYVAADEYKALEAIEPSREEGSPGPEQGTHPAVGSAEPAAEGRRSAAERSGTRPVRILAPLDNLLWERELVSKIFGFDYSWEVYLPKAKRKYGYYVLPVLWGESLVARFEPTVDRARSCLRIENLWTEPALADADRPAFREAFRAELESFVAYLGLERAEMPE